VLPSRFCRRQSCVVVGPSGTAGHAYLAHRDDVQGVVELPVAAERQAMTDAFCAGHLDWGNAGVAGEGGGEHSECCTHRYRLDEF